MIKVTTVKKVLKEIAKEQPDTTAACYYSVEEHDWKARQVEWVEATGGSFLDYEKVEPKPVPQTPMCIVGQVVSRINGPEALAQIPFGIVVENEYMIDDEEGPPVFAALGYTPAAIKVLSEVQSEQDSGVTWMRAVNKVL